MNTYHSYFVQLTKRQLTTIARLHRMPGYSTYNKEDLVSALEAFLRKEDTIRNFFTYLGNDEIEQFLSGNSSKNRFLCRRLRDAGYCFLEAGDYVFPSDLTIPLLTEESFQKAQLKNSLLLDCLDTAGYLYGSAPLSILQEMYHNASKETISQEEIITFIENLPDYFSSFAMIDNLCVHTSLIPNDLYAKIRQVQGAQPYYYPSESAIHHMARYGFLKDPAMDKLLIYLTKSRKLDVITANSQAALVQADFRQGGSIKDVLDALEKQYHADYKQDSVFLALVNEVFASSRLLLSRGYTANEKHTQDKHPQKIYPNSPCPCGSGKKYKKCCGRRK